MIFNLLFDLLSSLFLLVADAISLVPLPVALMDVLFDIFCYGTWVVGADFMASFITAVAGWYYVRWSIGILVFLWDLLPFT